MANPEIDHRFILWARLGYIARGVVYLIIGILAILAAVGQGGQTTDSKGALYTIWSQPFGPLLLGLLAFGLLGHALWRLVQSVMDLDGHGTSRKAMAIRGGLLASAVAHAALAVSAAALAVGIGGGSNDAMQDWTIWLLEKPFGRALVVLLGLAFFGAGVAHWIKALRERYKRYLQPPAGSMKWVSPLSKFGLCARGTVFCLIGIFLGVAAYRINAGEAKGLAGVLSTLLEQPFGPYLLGLVALGLVAFAIYSAMEGFYRRMGRSRS